jgi:DeoR/GlpR family transcriptional regulator of sugar metabolism
LNVSRQTIYSYLEQLENAGKIRRTDQGIEVLE